MTDEEAIKCVSVNSCHTAMNWKAIVSILIPELGASGISTFEVSIDPSFSKYEANQVGSAAGIAVAKKLKELIG